MAQAERLIVLESQRPPLEASIHGTLVANHQQGWCYGSAGV